jgi:hypothetical protein
VLTTRRLAILDPKAMGATADIVTIANVEDWFLKHWTYPGFVEC